MISGGAANVKFARLPLRLDAGDLADAVHVALHPVAAHRGRRRAGRARGSPDRPAARPPSVVRRSVSATALNSSTAPSMAGHREAAAVDRHRVADARRPAAIPGASTARSTPPPDGSHDRICPDSMTMPGEHRYGSWISKILSSIRADRRRSSTAAGSSTSRVEEAGPRAELDGRVKDRQTVHRPRSSRAVATRRARPQAAPTRSGGDPAPASASPDRRTSSTSTSGAATPPAPGARTTSTGAPGRGGPHEAELARQPAAAVEHDAQRLALGRRIACHARSGAGRRRARCRCRPSRRRPGLASRARGRGSRPS